MEYTMEYHGTPWTIIEYTMEYTIEYTMEYHLIYYGLYYGTSWTIMEYYGISCNILWNIYGISWTIYRT